MKNGKVSGLSELAVKRTTVQEGIEFDLLKTAWSIKALLVASRSVAAGGFAFSFSFSAFQNDDVSWHGLEEIGTRKLLKIPLRSRQSSGKIMTGGSSWISVAHRGPRD